MTETDGFCTLVECLSEGDHVVDVLTGRPMQILEIKVNTHLPSNLQTDAGLVLHTCSNADGSCFLVACSPQTALKDIGTCAQPQSGVATSAVGQEPTGFYEFTFERRVTLRLGQHLAELKAQKAQSGPNPVSQYQALNLFKDSAGQSTWIGGVNRPTVRRAL
ncbi:hypothetical protein [uncultured Tateyamaria sp.]|nr:hypothetical protein [uncultured Tateyamaria sp.]